MVLAVDTGSEACAVALHRAGGTSRGDAVDDAIVELVGQGHSRRLLPLIDALLGRNRLEPGDIDVYAFGAGPGSFTGLRIACSVVQGMSFVRDRPVVPVGSLHAMVEAALPPGARAAGCRALVAIDARLAEVYWALFEFDANAAAWRPRAAPALYPHAHLADLIARHAPRHCVGGVFAGVPGGPSAHTWTPDGLIRAIARLGHAGYASGETVVAALAAPAYVRDRVARTIEERRLDAAAAPAQGGVP